MQGKLVFNQSLSTRLSLKRFSTMAIPSALVEWKAFYSKKEGAGFAAAPILSYLLRVKSALPPPATVTDFDWFLAPSCHAITV